MAGAACPPYGVDSTRVAPTPMIVKRVAPTESPDGQATQFEANFSASF